MVVGRYTVWFGFRNPPMTFNRKSKKGMVNSVVQNPVLKLQHIFNQVHELVIRHYTQHTNDIRCLYMAKICEPLGLFQSEIIRLIIR